MIVVFTAIGAGLAALYVWVFLSQLHTPGFGRLQKWARNGWRVPLVSCPWCSGFWLSAVFVAVIEWGRWSFTTTPFAILGAAALCGFLGAMTPGFDFDEVDE